MHLEYIYGTEEKTVDLYIEDINLAIDLDGPVHFYADSGLRKANLGDRKRARDIDILRIKFSLFDQFLRGKADFTAF